MRPRRAKGARRPVPAPASTLPAGEVQCRCQWCGAPFVWIRPTPNQRAPLYCRPLHAKAARNAAEQRAARATTCPTPTKRSFPSQREANRAIARAGVGMREAHAYQCGCGAWHIGHPRYLRPTGPERTSR